MKKHLLFVYGTLKRGFGNHHYLKNSKFLGRAVTEEKYSLWSTVIPFVSPKPSLYQIKGEVYEIDERTLEEIDLLEGHPTVYKRELVPVILESGEKVQAWIYFHPPMGQLVPEGEWKGGRRYEEEFL